MTVRGGQGPGDFGEDVSSPSFWPLGWLGRAFGPSDQSDHVPQHTFRRLCTSRHLQDLQYIVLTVMLFAAASTVAFLVGPLVGLHLSYAEVAGAYAATLAAINWAYQAASRRMGTVDLFAAEISVICRVCLVVNFAKGSVKEAVERIERLARSDRAALESDAYGGRRHGLASPAPPEHKFTSQEDYTPAYDGHASDLTPLDADVVNLTAQFYTYRKTMLDLMRAAAEETDPVRNCHLWREMIYMQYLMYESGRGDVCWLIEYEPTRSESLVNILCSELVVYPFLLEHYREDDFRTARLNLRKAVYAEQVPKLIARIRSMPDNGDWKRARTTAGELEQRFDDMCRRIKLEVPLPSRVAA